MLLLGENTATFILIFSQPLGNLATALTSSSASLRLSEYVYCSVFLCKQLATVLKQLLTNFKSNCINVKPGVQNVAKIGYTRSYS